MAYGRFPLKSLGCRDRLLIVIQNGKATVKLCIPLTEECKRVHTL